MTELERDIAGVRELTERIIQEREDYTKYLLENNMATLAKNQTLGKGVEIPAARIVKGHRQEVAKKYKDISKAYGDRIKELAAKHRMTQDAIKRLVGESYQS